MFLIFSKPGCPFCTKAANVLDEHSLKYKVINAFDYFTEEQIDSFKSYCVSLMILAEHFTPIERKLLNKYITDENFEKSSQLIKEKREQFLVNNRITWPQVFVMSEELIDNIQSNLENQDLSLFILANKEINYIGTYTQLTQYLDNSLN